MKCRAELKPTRFAGALLAALFLIAARPGAAAPALAAPTPTAAATVAAPKAAALPAQAKAALSLEDCLGRGLAASRSLAIEAAKTARTV